MLTRLGKQRGKAKQSMVEMEQKKEDINEKEEQLKERGYVLTREGGEAADWKKDADVRII